jgi:uncharacterized glyoxalase superfamily protein PhnB
MTDDKTPPPQVWPSLRARDARRLIRFLVDVFGFEETAVYGDGDIVEHCQLSWPEGGGIMLGSVREDPANPWNLQPGSAGAYVVSDRVDEIYRRTVAAGATILQEPNDTDYGSHGFSCRDPEGNLWSFGTYRGEPRSAA